MLGRIGSKAYLVDHHDGKQVAECGKEKSVKVVLNVIANGVAEPVQDDLSADENQHTEADVTQRPAVLEGVHHQQ